MAAFALEDALIKAASQTLPVGLILIIFGFGGALVFACFALYNKEPLFNPDVFSKPMRLRVVFEIVGRLFYFLAIAYIPLSVATVILQATPLVVVIGAVWFFDEKVGWRRWTAIAFGLLGVIIVIRPGADSFSLLSILAVVGLVGFAGRDLASRAAPQTISTTLLGLYGFLSIVVAGLLISIWQSSPLVLPDFRAGVYLVYATLVGVFAYVALMKAMRTGEVSAVTPFRYSRLLFGVALGLIFFDEQVDGLMVLGCALIILSGLFLVWRRKVSAIEH